MVLQYQAYWNIPNAGPSVSTLHFQGSSGVSAQAIAVAVRQFLFTCRLQLPDDVSITFSPEVTQYNDATGQLVAAYPVTPGASVTGTITSVWAAGAGARVVWSTEVVRRGRRVRGATFIVPMAATQFTNTGYVASGAQNNLTAAGDQLIADVGGLGAPLAVYSRPVPGDPGTASTVTSCSVPSIVGSLRGRKY